MISCISSGYHVAYNCVALSSVHSSYKTVRINDGSGGGRVYINCIIMIVLSTVMMKKYKLSGRLVVSLVEWHLYSSWYINLEKMRVKHFLCSPTEARVVVVVVVVACKQQSIT